MDFRFYKLLGPEVKAEHFMCLHLIDNLSKELPGSKFPGWCYASKETLSRELKCSTRKTFSVLSDLENKGLILRNELGHIKVAPTTNQLYNDAQGISNEVTAPKGVTRKPMQNLHRSEQPPMQDLQGTSAKIADTYANSAHYTNNDSSKETSNIPFTSVNGPDPKKSKNLKIKVLPGSSWGHYDPGDKLPVFPTDPPKKKKSSAKKEKSPPPAKPKAPANPDHQAMKDLWLKYYSHSRNEEYYWAPKDARHLNELARKIRFKMQASGSPPDQLLTNWEHFIQAIDVKCDSWIKNNFAITNINSQFNQLYDQIKNGRKKSTYRKNQGTDLAELDGLIDGTIKYTGY